jgi:hypothetical protein
MKKTWSAILTASLLIVNLIGVARTSYAATSYAATSHAATFYAAPAAVKAAQTPDEMLRMTPDANAVVVINVAQLSVQIQALLSHDAELASKFQSQLNTIAAETGVNVQAIEQIVVTLSFDAAANPAPVILLAGAFDQEQILARTTSSSSKKWKAKRYKGQRIYVEPGQAGKSKEKATISFFDDQSKIAFGTNRDVKRVIDARAGSQSTVTGNAALMSALQQTAANASIRFAFTIPEEVRQKLRAVSGVPFFITPLTSIVQVMGTVDLNENGLQANVSLITSSAKEASDLVALINQGLSLAKVALGNYPGGQLIISILNGVSVAQAGNAAEVAVTVPADVIRRLIDELRSVSPRP